VKHKGDNPQKDTTAPMKPVDLISKLEYDKIKWELLTTKDLLSRNSRGISFATIAAKRGIFCKIPKGIITKEVLTQNTSDDECDKVIHKLTRSKQIRAVPKKLLTENLLSTPGDYGDSCYHILAQDNNSMFIPDELWTKTALTLQNNNNETPLHDICENDSDIIPKNITLNELLLESDTGITPLHTWAASPNWYKIPNEHLTRRTLELPIGDAGLTLLNSLVEQYENQKNSGWYTKDDKYLMEEKMKGILSLATDKKLKYFSNMKNSHIAPLAKNEIGKRMIMKKILEDDKAIEI
jgi:hypothetical protein